MAYKMTLRRKLAIATWDAPREGNIYGKLTIDATRALEYIEHVRAQTGEKVTITHLVGKACAMALAKAPSLNGTIRFWRYVPHDHVNIAFLVALEEGENLGKAKVDDADRKSVADIARELRELAEKLRKGEDKAFKKSMGSVAMLPGFVLKPLLKLTGFLASSLGLSIPPLGVEPFPFGSCIVTSVGMFGLDEGYAPPTPFARVPVYVLVGALREQPTVVDGQVTVRSMLTITATIDHRFMDGFQGGVLAKTVREVLENPWILEGREGPPPLLTDSQGAGATTDALAAGDGAVAAGVSPAEES